VGVGLAEVVEDVGEVGEADGSAAEAAVGPGGLLAEVVEDGGEVGEIDVAVEVGVAEEFFGDEDGVGVGGLSAEGGKVGDGVVDDGEAVVGGDAGADEGMGGEVTAEGGEGGGFGGGGGGSGSATGFFAFEFERRGAEVVSVELPDLERLDRFPGQDTLDLLNKIEVMIQERPAEGHNTAGRARPAEQMYYYMLDAPFQLCARLLNSRVERRYGTVYELSPKWLGKANFDLVFAGDVLVHTLHPFAALTALAGMCSGTLVIAQVMPGSPADPPAILYDGGETTGEDRISWWLPNEKCFKQLLRKLGFADVVAVGNHEGIHRPAGNFFSRRIIHAKRAGAHQLRDSAPAQENPALISATEHSCPLSENR